MTINQERFPTYKPLSPVLRTQTTYVFEHSLSFYTTKVSSSYVSFHSGCVNSISKGGILGHLRRMGMITEQSMAHHGDGSLEEVHQRFEYGRTPRKKCMSMS